MTPPSRILLDEVLRIAGAGDTKVAAILSVIVGTPVSVGPVRGLRDSSTPGADI